MKIIASTVLVALFAAAQSRFLNADNTALTVTQTYTASYANTLQCGACVGGGNIYCIQKTENTTANTFMTGTTQQTCIAAGTLDTKLSDATWSCTNAFNDRVYSKYVCQYNTASCGSVQNYNLMNTTSNATFNITNLLAGQTCMYKVQAQCGGPAFTPSGDTAKVELEFVEYNGVDLPTTDTVTGYTLGSMNMVKRASAPLIG